MKKPRLNAQPGLFDNVPETGKTNSDAKVVVEETTSSEISEHDRLMLFTDFIGEEHRLWCYLFRLEVLEKKATIYSTPVIKAFLCGLHCLRGRNGEAEGAAFAGHAFNADGAAVRLDRQFAERQTPFPKGRCPTAKQFRLAREYQRVRRCHQAACSPRYRPKHRRTRHVR